MGDLCPFIHRVSEVISLGTAGIAQFGEYYAHKKCLPVVRLYGEWPNEPMGGYADALILIWDGQDKESAKILKTAKQEHLDIFVFDYTKWGNPRI